MLRLIEVPDPEPGTVDVVVRVRATSVNRLDVVQRAGWFTLPGFALPHIAGMDVAGEIAAIGSEVDGLVVDLHAFGVEVLRENFDQLNGLFLAFDLNEIEEAMPRLLETRGLDAIEGKP